MPQDLFFTAGQFARLHRLNKRTLHYYDEIGLFSPAFKGENGYRYYTYAQSITLENILALRELGMSIEELKAYLQRPSAEQFLTIAGQKTGEIDRQIRRLQQLQALLEEKQRQLALCAGHRDGDIEVVSLPAQELFLISLPDPSAGDAGWSALIPQLQEVWQANQYKTGCGSCLSLEKVRQGNFEAYDSLFVPLRQTGSSGAAFLRPPGDYLCGYCVGGWDKLPAQYQKMLDFAAEQRLTLTGNCYELGLNEFAISRMEEYVTEIQIACRA